MVVTMGRFTGPAEEYAVRLRQNADLHLIDLIAELQPHESSSETRTATDFDFERSPLQPHESSSETPLSSPTTAVPESLQPHESSSETVDNAFGDISVQSLQPHESSSETRINR